jgi:hypothetical protein
MTFLRKILGRRQPPARSKDQWGDRGRGLLVFDHTSEVIRAESRLRKEGFQIRIKGPPPGLSTGCDMVIEFPLIQELAVRRALAEAKINLKSVVAVEGPLLEPVSLIRVKDFGDYVMVRAANMKLTVDKRDGLIVNVSGGGCPDVPYLADALVGKRLCEAPEPRSLGHTLCGYALQMAFEEVTRLCPG